MVRNHTHPHPLLGGELEGWVSDVGWGMFVNFLSYKLEREGKVLVEIDRFFPSSKTCSQCHYQIDQLPLDVRFWDCPSCGTHHDRDENAAINIRAEGIRMLALSEVEGLTVSGTGTAADGGDVRPRRGRKSVLRQSPMKSEAHAIA
jgi:putative transposase